MRFTIIAALFLVLSIFGAIHYSLAFNCGDRWQSDGADTYGGRCNWTPGTVAEISQTKHWKIFWTDGYERANAEVTGAGVCYTGYTSNTRCYPTFETPYWALNVSNKAQFAQRVTDASYEDVCTTLRTHTEYHRHNCDSSGGGGNWECMQHCGSVRFAGKDSSEEPSTDNLDDCCLPTPILIDVLGNGFALTSAANGVMFDFNGDGTAHRIS